jgi:Arc/MetJ family transcription regulator
MRMKRTNLVLDESLLDEVVKLSGERTYSAAVSRALSEFVRRARAHRILELAGSGLWEGNLAEMRNDHPVQRSRRQVRGSR